MKVHLSNIYYYINKNIYFSHILSKKIIKRLINILNKHEYYLINENKILRKLYTLLRNKININCHRLKEKTINELVIQITEHIKSNMFNFIEEDYQTDVYQKNSGYYLDEESIKRIRIYFEKHKKINEIHITYFISYFLDLNIQNLLKKLDIELFLEEICNKQTNNI